MSSNFINNYVFHYNKHTGTWSAIPRDLYKEYWNDAENTQILRSQNINTLVEILDRMGRVTQLSDILSKE